MVILHYTGMENAAVALERLCDPESSVSAHYVIEEDGKSHTLVSEDKRAWHAGLSYWAGETDINSASIGIELVNPGHEFGYQGFPDKQIKALEKLCLRLMEKYNILPAYVLGHSDIAPGRKMDPGEKFPWESLATKGIGLWPRPQEKDYQTAEDLILNPGWVLELLGTYGYNPNIGFETLITEFHRHFYPEKFEADEDPAQPDIKSIARLLSLIRQNTEAFSQT